jgi:hypothetical protein
MYTLLLFVAGPRERVKEGHARGNTKERHLAKLKAKLLAKLKAKLLAKLKAKLLAKLWERGKAKLWERELRRHNAHVILQQRARRDRVRSVTERFVLTVLR